MLSVPDEHRRQSLNSGRRGSYSDDVTSPRSPRPPPRHKPPLDEAILAARQQYAAHGLMVIMRRKVAKRRRVLREQTSFALDGGEVMEERSAVIDAATTDDDTDKAPQTMNNSYIISAIPYMPKPVATICLVLNIILPGSGTMLSGLSACCCGKSRMHSHEHNYVSVFCVNLMVGTMQFCTVTFLLVGWAWSLVWGIYMIILAEEHHKELKAAHDRELQAKVIVAMNGRLRPWTMIGHKDNS